MELFDDTDKTVPVRKTWLIGHVDLDKVIEVCDSTEVPAIKALPAGLTKTQL